MLIEKAFISTQDVRTSDRFDFWREQVCETYVPTEIDSDCTANFAASQRILALGAVQLWTVEHPPMTLRRSRRLIRRSDPGLYHLSLPLRGTMRLTRPGHEAEYAPHDLVLHDTSRPHLMRAITGHGQDTVLGTGLFVPRELLPLPENAIDRLLMRPLPGRDGVGGLLAHVLTQVARDFGSYRPDDGPRLGVVVLDLLSALLAHALEAQDALPSETRRQALVLRIRAFVQQHLCDPHLTPRTIAAAHHISLSYLHRLFQDEEETVAAWIRLQRLERARRDLADPAMRTASIHAIGARWCFPRASDFTRAFRTVYGVPPSDYRHQALCTTE
ncbi:MULTISPECIES: helix-turn-helix domain-containing protein [unclassified Streptomyces]|uniref:AraC-like ligand-binding domain-containing protein n=1 Tax=unclassified Streptomyces TaxID=2593676 RepID=UPI000B9681B9|nr:helix-turn-helix domain-containing protein [Streptomyces sp. FBKL.4005]OYP10541.1 AraC family transcriptional regulator [Streptomyces sp. FBKL.4005]